MGGLAVQEDLPSVELHSLSTRVKFYLIDRIGTWVPTYRTYMAVKEPLAQIGQELALVAGPRRHRGQVLGRPLSLLAFALSLALLAVQSRSSTRNRARLMAALAALLLAAQRGARGVC